MPDDIKRRMPSVERRIDKIKPGDIRVRLLGTVIDKQDNMLIIDDGSGKMDISFDTPANAELGQLVRVFGRLIPLDNGFQVKGEIMQDMTGLDFSLYKRVNAIVNK